MILVDPDVTNPVDVFEIGHFLNARGEFEESMPYLQHALHLAEPLQDLNLTWNILENIAAVADNVGEFYSGIKSRIPKHER